MRFDDYVNGRIFPPPTTKKIEKTKTVEMMTVTDQDKAFLLFLEQCERERQREAEMERKSRRDLRIAYSLMVISTIFILIISILKPGK